MLISLKWLKRYVELNQSPAEIAAALTAVGLEVEGTEDQGAPYDKMVAGKVISCEQHPDSDHLSLTKVFDGKSELQVVCGAPNVAAGQTVAFAPVGTVLPMPDGKDLKLKKAKIRGVESFGMICAEDEIGLGTSHDGILVLDDSIEAGTNLKEYGLWDIVFEVNVTPNRPDALSHIGVARELAAFFNKDLLIPEYTLVQAKETSSSLVKLEVEDGKACSRYTGAVIRNVKIGPSPDWMQKLLFAVGLSPVNNVVDITNFVLMETGQPLHAFDLKAVQSGTIRVRRAQKGEKLETIDHTERELHPDDLLICDGDTPACVAGVMGGVSTEITDETKDVFLECAWFDPGTIRRQAKRLGMSSDSSYRFERGVDPFRQQWVCDYTATMIALLAEGEALTADLSYTSEDHKVKPDVVALRPSRIERILGMKVEAEEIRTKLSGIGLILKEENADNLVWEIPGFRPDLEREVDLVEEVARLVGFHRIPSLAPSFELKLNPLPAEESVGLKVRNRLAALGLQECCSLRFASPKTTEVLFGASGHLNALDQSVKLLNPINEGWSLMPVSQLCGLLESVSRNEKNREYTVRLFELGKTFHNKADERSDKKPGVQETLTLSGVIAGDWENIPWNDQPADASFGILKGVLQNLMKVLRLPMDVKRPEDNESQPYLHPHRQAQVWSGETLLGHCGQLHPAKAKDLEITLPTVLWELNFDLILALLEQNKAVFQPYSKFGAVSRDISLITAEKTENQQILELIESIQVKNKAGAELKSVFTGEKIGTGKKNLVYTIWYQHMDQTLTDEQVNKAQEKLRLKMMESELVELR